MASELVSPLCGTLQEVLELQALSERAQRNELDPLLLILDLDGTLVPESDLDLNGQDEVMPRPFFFELIRTCVQLNITLGVWSNAGEGRVKQIVTSLFHRNNIPLAFVFSSNKAVRRLDKNGESYNAKPLAKIWGKNRIGKVTQKCKWTRRNTLILDNTPSTYSQNRGNAIRIRTWEGYRQQRAIGKQDVELARIASVLRQNREMKDVREPKKATTSCYWLSLWTLDVDVVEVSKPGPHSPSFLRSFL